MDISKQHAIELLHQEIVHFESITYRSHECNKKLNHIYRNPRSDHPFYQQQIADLKQQTINLFPEYYYYRGQARTLISQLISEEEANEFESVVTDLKPASKDDGFWGFFEVLVKTVANEYMPMEVAADRMNQCSEDAVIKLREHIRTIQNTWPSDTVKSIEIGAIIGNRGIISFGDNTTNAIY